MPTIARSRRRSRRQDSNEEIESGNDFSQELPRDDVEEENEVDKDLPRRPSKTTAKRAKGKKAVRKREDEEDGDGAENTGEIDVKRIEEQLEVDVSNFQDQPFGRAEAMKLGGLAGDWEAILRQVRNSAFEVIKDVGSSLAEVGDGKDGELALKELSNVDILMRELLDTQAELQAHHDVLEDIKNRIVRGEKITDVTDQYEQGVADSVQTWQAKTSRQKYAKDEDYMAFKQRIFEVQRPDEAMPPMSEFIDKEDGDDSNDEDLEVGGATQQIKCPITLTVMMDPVQSSKCGHNYSKAAIMDYLRNRQGEKCPSTGCDKFISRTDLKPNKDLEKRIRAYLRREKLKAAEHAADAESVGDDDDDEVIENDD